MRAAVAWGSAKCSASTILCPPRGQGPSPDPVPLDIPTLLPARPRGQDGGAGSRGPGPLPRGPAGPRVRRPRASGRVLTPAQARARASPAEGEGPRSGPKAGCSGLGEQS